MKILTSKLSLISAAGTLMMVASVAHAATSLPPIQHMDGIDYVTGGIGQEESSAIEHASRSWPLTMEFAVKDKQHADFVSGVRVQVHDAAQHVKFKVMSDGPFVLAGFSFGSLCALRAAARVTPEVLFLIGVPVDRWVAAGDVPPGTRVVWIQGGNDEFSAQERAGEIAAARGWTFRAVRGADHFFTGRLDEFESAAGDALAEWLGK